MLRFGKKIFFGPFSEFRGQIPPRRVLIKDKEGGQCQLGAPLLCKMAIGADKKSSVPVSALSHLLDCETRVVKGMIDRGNDAKLELVADQTRPKAKRGT